MLPGVYGFTWDAGNIIFLGIFFTVVIIIGTTVARAWLRATADLKQKKAEAIRWQEDFHDLPASLRVCRHEITGDLKQRTCPNGFDCRECELHPRIEARKKDGESHASPAVVPEMAWGLDLPADRLYHRGHTWVKPEANGTALVGIDDFGSRVLGTIEQTELPAIGSDIRVNGTAWTITNPHGNVRILSPLDGKVVETGGAEQGWYLRVAPLNESFDLRHLLRPEEAMAWTMRELERLQMALGQDSVGPALADGGEPVKNFPRNYPQANWDGVWGEVFLEP